MKNTKQRIFGLTATFGIAAALFAATGKTAARADGDDWYRHDHYEQSRFDREHDREVREHRRIEQEREWRLAQERRIERERHDRRERGHRNQFQVDFNFGHETHGDHDWR